MFDRSERPSTRWIAWMPLLFVSAFLYWSVALGLGGLSLMATDALRGGCHVRTWQMNAASIEPIPGHAFSGDPIIVHLQESTEANDEQGEDTAQAADIDLTDDDGTGRLPGRSN